MTTLSTRSGAVSASLLAVAIADPAAADFVVPADKLDAALDAAGGRGWTLVSMKNDWNAVFPP